MRELLCMISIFFMGCGTADPVPSSQPAPPNVPAPPTPPPTPIPARCDDMTASQCMSSVHCVLEMSPEHNPRYVCREAVAPCEGGIAQIGEGFRENCEARAGCEFHPTDCFCPSTTQTRVPEPVEGPDCYCGGGALQHCTRR